MTEWVRLCRECQREGGRTLLLPASGYSQCAYHRPIKPEILSKLEGYAEVMWN